MERIAIMGLGPISASIGLALKQAELKTVEIVGFDRDRRAVSEAVKIGAVDEGTGVYRRAMEGAQLVIMDSPLAEAEETLGGIASLVEDGCVVTDVRATKSASMKRAAEILPSGTGFVGGHPLPKRRVGEIKDASPSLLTGTDYCVISPPSADQGAVGTVVGMVEAIGANPFFLDPEEHDAFVAGVEDLPTVVSYALVNATTGSASWRDMARLASETFNAGSTLASKDPKSTAADHLANKDALVQWIDQVIAELYSYRNDLSKESEDLAASFIRAWENRAKWKAGVVTEEKELDVPSSKETFAGLFIGRRLWDRQRKILGAGKRDPWEYQDRR